MAADKNNFLLTRVSITFFSSVLWNCCKADEFWCFGDLDEKGTGFGTQLEYNANLWGIPAPARANANQSPWMFCTVGIGNLLRSNGTFSNSLSGPNQLLPCCKPDEINPNHRRRHTQKHTYRNTQDIETDTQTPTHTHTHTHTHTDRTQEQE